MQVISILDLAPYYIASRIFAKIENMAFAKKNKKKPDVPSAHFMVWFLGCHRLCIKET